MAYLIVLFAVLSRFIPHSPNFSPVFGALLFGGVHLRSRDSVWFPVVLLAISDVLLTTQVYHMRLGWTQSVTWLGFVTVALVGRWLRTRISVLRFVAAALAGPTAFFLISNFGVWLGWRMYPPTWQGLVVCYGAAVPFYRNSLVSSLLFGALLLGAYELYKRKFVHSEIHNCVAQTR